MSDLEHAADLTILIRNPLTLLYWLYFRGLALRRYAYSIHPELDDDLKVWEVRHAVDHDPRFQALCRARWMVLAGAPLLAALLAGGAAQLAGATFAWRSSLAIVAGYTTGTLLGDLLRWFFPGNASRRLGWFLVFVVSSASIIPVVARFLPALEFLSLLALLATLSPSLDVFLVAVGVAVGVTVGVAFGVAVAVAVGVAVGVVGGV
ncbi:MAG TPA: hypothetical protein VLA19_10265, partial [Herpetosiphonaceae bacterium]|nr:hypothetical protein [Herpetosiphonaceae bacterium]